jgi:hypothetical protein
MIDQATSQRWQEDSYPARCRGCGLKSTLVLRWNVSGEVRKTWDGTSKARVDLRQPRSSTAQCAACGSTDLAISKAEIA